MVLKGLFRKVFHAMDKIKHWSGVDETIYPEEPLEDSKTGIYSIWDFLSFSDNTQAFHLVNVIGFDEWVDMEEIRRRIKELFSVEYKNEKSLYPYLKTLTDVNFFESSNIGGRRKWRKKDLLFELEVENKKENGKEEAVLKLKAKSKKDSLQ